MPSAVSQARLARAPIHVAPGRIWAKPTTWSLFGSEVLECAASVPLPAVPRGIGELDADCVDVVVALVDHVLDLIGDHDELLGVGRDDADPVGRAATVDGLPFLGGGAYGGDVVEEDADAQDGQV
jgi:hypothetical protein